MIFKPFEKQHYLTIETFRKNGVGVKTPVWFVEDGESLYVWTQTTTGKAKRIRNNGNVRIAPSTGSGTPTGEWVSAYATANDAAEVVNRVTDLMKKKYGFQFYFFGFLGRLRGGSKYTALQIQAKPSASN